MKLKEWIKKTAAALAAVLSVGMAVPYIAQAATVPNATIDMGKNCSLTMYKYDLTKAEENGITQSFVSTGHIDQEAEAAYAPYAIQGVKFTYLRVGDIALRTSRDVGTGVAKVEVIYGLTDKTAACLETVGLKRSDKVESRGGLEWYASDTLIKTIENALVTEKVNTKNTLETYVKENGGTTMPETDVNGKTVASNLKVGLYLVCETYVPEDVISTTNPFFVSLPMTDNDGDEWNYDVTAYPKNQTGSPTLDKEVAEVTSAKNGTPAYSDTATACDGDLVAYRITSTLPAITSEATYLTTYTFSDTLSKGITYNREKKDVTLTWFDTNGDRVTVWKQNDEAAKFSVSYGSGKDGVSTMTIAMTAAGFAEINPSYSLHTVVIDYTTTVNSDASVVYGDDGNPNDVMLEWRRTNTAYFDTLHDDCIVYVYGIDLLKKFNDGNGDFSKVKFKVKNQTDGYYVTAKTEKAGIYYVTGTVGADESAGTVFIPSPDGELKIYGLEDDTYIATEIATDDHYQLLKENITIVITSTAGVHRRAGSATVNGVAAQMLPSGKSANALVSLHVMNYHEFHIPDTGDTNTFLLPVLGCALGAVVVLIAAMKKEKRDLMKK